jgi:tRNA(Arg) A34 adenosine deaminase TadA
LENYIRQITIEVEKSCLDFKIGGPFGALVLKDGKVIGRGVNRVIGKHDPTAHAEMEAIRDACINLKTHDLSGCELYATGFPCPMCMSAIIWSNIKKVYYSADYKDAEAIGFRDSYIYNFIKEGQKNKDILELVEVNKDSIIDIYKKFVETKGEIY